MSSLNPKISRTIFSFPIGRVETKIFHFEDIGLEVERSQSIDPKISNWVFSHLFLLPPRTHSNWQNRIWMSVTHFTTFEDPLVTGLRGGERSQEDNLKITSCEIFLKAWVFIWVSHELDIPSRCDHSFSNCQSWWTWAKQPQIHARMMKMWLKFEKINFNSYERFSFLDHNETHPISFG